MGSKETMLGERQQDFAFLEVSHGKKSQLWDQSISQACLVFFANRKAYFCPKGSNVKTGLDSAVVSFDIFEFITLEHLYTLYIELFYYFDTQFFKSQYLEVVYNFIQSLQA